MFVSENNLKILREVLDEYTKQASESLSVPAEIENYKFSKRFENFMQRLIRRQRKSYYRFIDTTAKRVASYAIILLICAVVTVFSVKALREPFINFVVETYEKFTSIFVQKDYDISPANTNLEFEIMMPTYIPEGYELVDTKIGESSIVYIYTNSNSNLYVRQNKLQDWGWFVDTENINYEKIKINYYDGIFYENKGKGYLIFNNKKYTFDIVGGSQKEELIKIAESIE